MRRAAALASALTLACAPAGSGQAASPGPAASSALVRVIEPFPVVDADGRPYALPFLGGLNIPRPQWVDAEGDGDLDLFIQEYTGRLMFFERLPAAAGGPTYAFRSDRFGGVDVGEWYRFVDADGDGDPDLMSEEPFSYVRLWRNRGAGAHAPDLELWADTLRDAQGEPIFSDRQNIPNAADIDCDALLDLMIGRTIGTIARHEAAAPVGPDVPPFPLLTDRFEDIQIVGVAGQRLPGGSRHGANTMALADHDGDGDVDLFWGDFFEPGLLLIENTGTCAEPVMAGEPVPFPERRPVRTSGYNAPTFGDVDGDGDLDLLMGVLGGAFNANTTSVDNLLLFEQVDGRFELRTSRYLTQIDVGSESVPAALDVDGDGDLDLVVSNKIDPADLETSLLHVFENVGDAGRPSFRRAGTLDVPGAYHNAPAFGDLDGDGDADLLLGTWRDEILHFRNDGGSGPARFVLVDSAIVKLTRGSNAMPALGDLDGDGDLDLLVGESSGTINFFRNVGGPGGAAFELVSDAWAGIEVERRSAPALADVDGDGDLDLLVGTERQGVRLWRNVGTAQVPDFAETDPLLPDDRAPAFSVPLVVDLRGDGRPALVVGGASGGLYWFDGVGAR